MRLSGSQKRALGVRSAFLGLLRRLRPGESRSNRESGFFLLCIQITRNRRISFPSSAATVVAPGPPMSGKDGCCSLVVLPSVPPRTSRCGSNCISEKARARIPAASSYFCNFFAAPYSSRRIARVSRSAGGPGQPHCYYTRRGLCNRLIERPAGHRRPAPVSADPRRRPRRHQKPVSLRSARRLASSEAAPVRLAGS